MISGLTEGDVLSVLFRIVITPIVGYLFWVWMRQQRAVERLQEKQAESEKSHAVILIMVDNIKEDIKEIKYGIEKMLDRRQSERYEKSPHSKK